jgi:hypothetical protein
MNYASKDFIALMGEIDKQGGEHVDETCMWHEVDFKMPDGTTRHVKSSGCEKDMLFDVPYDPSATVLVPEPVLEEDPDRSGYTDRTGTQRPTTRTKTYEDDEGRKFPVVEFVEREGEVEEMAGTALALPVRVCAIEDNVGMWPRFRHVITDPRSR